MGTGFAKVAGTGAANSLNVGGRPSNKSVRAPASWMLAAVRVWATKVLLPRAAVSTPASLAAIEVSGVTPISPPEEKDGTTVTIDAVEG